MTIKQLCQAREQLAAQIAQLEKAKDDLSEQIIQLVGHEHVGQKTYDIEGCKLTITTKENFTLDKARLNVEWEESMPINRSYSYTLREKDFKAVMEHGTADQKAALSEIVTSKPAKPVLKWKE